MGENNISKGRLKVKVPGHKEGYVDGYVTFKMRERSYEGYDDTVMAIVVCGKSIDYYSIYDLEVIP